MNYKIAILCSLFVVSFWFLFCLHWQCSVRYVNLISNHFRFAPLGRSVSSTTAVQEWPARGSLITPPPSNNQPNTATTSTSTTNTSQHCALSRPPSSPPPNPPPPPGPPMPVPVASTCGCACELGVRVCMCCGGVGKARATARARGGTVVCCLVRFGLHRYTASPAEGVPRMYQATT